MKTGLAEVVASGVLVEFRDSRGNTLGQAMFADWRGRPLPGVGDVLTSDVPSIDGAQERMRGRVIARRFDLQRESDGSPCVWVWLVVEAQSTPAQSAARRAPLGFSSN